MSEKKKKDKEFIINESLSKDSVRVVSLKPSNMPKSLKPKEEKKE